MITNFNKRNLDVVRGDLRSALEAVGRKHGLTFNLKGIRYGHDNFRVSLECNVGTDTSIIEQKAWEKSCWKFNLNEDMFGKTFIFGGKSYQICGIKPKSRKYPVLARRNLDDKVFKFAPVMVKGAK